MQGWLSINYTTRQMLLIPGSCEPVAGINSTGNLFMHRLVTDEPEDRFFYDVIVLETAPADDSCLLYVASLYRLPGKVLQCIGFPLFRLEWITGATSTNGLRRSTMNITCRVPAVSTLQHRLQIVGAHHKTSESALYQQDTLPAPRPCHW